LARTADGGIGEGRGGQPLRRDLLDEAGVLACQVLPPKLLVTVPRQLPVAPHSGQLELICLPATPVQQQMSIYAEQLSECRVTSSCSIRNIPAQLTPGFELVDYHTSSSQEVDLVCMQIIPGLQLRHATQNPEPNHCDINHSQGCRFLGYLHNTRKSGVM
jgi:hypothetical protein